MKMLPDISTTSKRWGVLLIMMIAGFYLAMSSIISLSYIGDAKESKLPVIIRFDSTMISLIQSAQEDNLMQKNMDSLTSRVEELSQQIAKLNIYGRNDSRFTPKQRNYFKKSTIKLIEQVAFHTNQLMHQRNLILMNLNLSEKFRIAELLQLRVQFKESVEKLTAGLLSKYAESVIIYSLKLKATDSFATSYYRFNANYLLVCQCLLNFRSQLDLFLSQLTANSVIDESASPFDEQLVTLPPVEAYAISPYKPASVEKPVAGQLGQDWGFVFSVFIRFIAGSRNIDVLLLVGMLGFGMFGSAISIYIVGDKNNIYRTPTQDLMLVLVRGFSAAVVVFLALRGGIAIFNKGESNPDPLMLFLFCFIGSVFSEPIWRWAKKLIDDNFSSEGQPEPETREKKEPAQTTKLQGTDLPA